MKYFYTCIFMLLSFSSLGAVLLHSQTGSPLCVIGERVNRDFLPSSLVEQSGEEIELQECSQEQILAAMVEKMEKSHPQELGLPLVAFAPALSQGGIPRRVTLASASLMLGCTIAGLFMLDARELAHKDVEVTFKAPGWLGFMGITAATFGTLMISDAKKAAHFAAGAVLNTSAAMLICLSTVDVETKRENDVP